MISGLCRPVASGCAQPHPLHHHAVDTVAGKARGRGKPDEINALFLGIGNLALAARHVRLVAAIEALDAGRALPDRGAHAIHRGVAAADHHDALARRVQLAALEFRHLVAKAFAVRGGQIIDRAHDAIGAHARRVQIARSCRRPWR
jgi:hypothetical protein